MRTLLLMLLLTNLGLLAWGGGALRGFGIDPQAHHEPQRLQQQFHPEQLLPQPAASAPQR